MISEGLALSPDIAEHCGVSIRATDAVLAAMQAAQNFLPYKILVRELTTSLRAGADQVETLITSLWQHDFIRTDLRPPFTTDDPARYVLQRLTGISAGREAAAILENILEATKGNSAPSFAHTAPKKPSNTSTQRRLPAFQIDVATPLEGRRISKAVADEAARAAELLLRMTAYPSGLSHIAAFRQHFIQRYGYHRQVPVLELLDPNFGLGVQWKAAIAELDEPIVEGDHVQCDRSRVLLDLAYRALSDRTPVIKLTPDLLATLETWSPALQGTPPSLDISVLVAASSAHEIDSGKFQIVIGPGAGAGGGGRFSGRFAGLLGRQGNDLAQMIARAEEATAPGALWAELVCVPRHLRLSNVAIRPAARRYEVVLDTTPGVDDTRVIRPDDLVVGVRDDRFYVRWLVREADVRICSGHMLAPNCLSSLGRFLAEVSQDRSPWLHMFYWGPAELLPYLPRLEVGRIVLRPAQWRLRLGELGGSQVLLDPGGFNDSLARYRERVGIPRHVYLGLSSERLLLDLDDTQQSAELRSELERVEVSDGIVMQEVVPAIEQAWLKGPGGKYASELIVTLIRRSERLLADIPIPSAAALKQTVRRRYSNLQRVRAPGSEWLYLKLCCGRDFQNDVLAHRLREFCEKVLANEMVNEWFFVRYADPDDHLRVRFRGVPERLWSDLMPLLCSWASALVTDDLCRGFSFETYERELERYGGPEGMAISESIFSADSRAAVSLLQLQASNGTKLDKMLLSALSTDDLLCALGASAEVRLKVYRALAPNHEGGDAFRRHKMFLRRALEGTELPVSLGIQRVSSLFEKRRDEVIPLGARLTNLAQSGLLTRELWELYATFVHLHLNRLLGAIPTEELTVCGMLRRLQHGLALTQAETGKHHKFEQ